MDRERGGYLRDRDSRRETSSRKYIEHREARRSTSGLEVTKQPVSGETGLDPAKIFLRSFHGRIMPGKTKLIVAFEVILDYMMPGGLISILATKFARRND